MSINHTGYIFKIMVFDHTFLVYALKYIIIFLQVCNSYPELTVVPASVDDTMLIASAKFRQNGRFPVLSYRHEKGVSNKFKLYLIYVNKMQY